MDHFGPWVVVRWHVSSRSHWPIVGLAFLGIESAVEDGLDGHCGTGSLTSKKNTYALSARAGEYDILDYYQFVIEPQI